MRYSLIVLDVVGIAIGVAGAIVGPAQLWPIALSLSFLAALLKDLQLLSLGA